MLLSSRMFIHGSSTSSIRLNATVGGEACVWTIHEVFSLSSWALFFVFSVWEFGSTVGSILLFVLCTLTVSLSGTTLDIALDEISHPREDGTSGSRHRGALSTLR